MKLCNKKWTTLSRISLEMKPLWGKILMLQVTLGQDLNPLVFKGIIFFKKLSILPYLWLSFSSFPCTYVGNINL